MLKVIFTVSCFFLTFYFSSAQVVGTNMKQIDPKRYAEIKESPYFYENWQAAILTTEKNKKIDNVEVNYNGYSNEFEAKVEGGYVELDPNWYSKIIILSDSSYFQYALHPQLSRQYTRVLFQGASRSLMQTFVVTISKREVQSPGKTIVLASFVPKSIYYLLEKEQLQLIKMKKKDIQKHFPQKEIATFVSQNKLKLNSEEDLIQLMKFAESLAVGRKQ